MRLVMAGLDYTTADVTAREAFALSGGELERVLGEIHAAPGVSGCAILATCNRCELYISHTEGARPDGIALLCGSLALAPADHRGYFTERRERAAAAHLMEVSSGIRSAILGDDQIITQVRTAIETAREAGTSDALLETLFRCAVTAGKKVKTSVTFAREGSSAASAAVRRLAERLPAGSRTVVIGSGVVGRLAASELAARGFGVTAALRNCAARLGEIPAGCSGVEYDRRFEAIDGADAVISATASPHLTVTRKDAEAADRLPGLFIDLAVPRDIDPEIASLPGVTVWNVDDFGRDEAEGSSSRRLMQALDILEEEAGRFEMWRQNRRRRLASHSGEPDFPIFINLHGAGVLVAGAGKVAARRTGALLGFGARVLVVSPAVSPEMERHLGRTGLTWEQREYRTEDMEGMTLAVAATDSREVNRLVGADARRRGILVSVADRREECTFYFPAIIQSDRLTAGLVSKNGDHGLVRRAAAAVRKELENFDENDTGGIAGECAGCGAVRAGYQSDTALASRH